MSIQAAAKHDRQKWQALAAKAQKKPETRLFIDGKFVDAKKGGRIESVKSVATFPEGGGMQIRNAEGGCVRSVDQLLAAIAACEIDNILVELSGPEWDVAIAAWERAHPGRTLIVD